MATNPYIEELGGLLVAAEGSGRIEYKRSCIWPSENDVHRVQKVLMRIANANRERGGIVQLGREDSGEILGLVNNGMKPVTPRELRAAEQTLVSYASRLNPPMQIQWHVHQQEDQNTIVIVIPGRPTGNWYEGENGEAWTGSASHPIKARREHLLQWAGESIEQKEHLAESQRVRPICSLRVGWISPHKVLEYVGEPLGLNNSVKPGQVIAYMSHETGETGFEAQIFATLTDKSTVQLTNENGSTLRPTLAAAAHPDTRSVDGEVILLQFRLVSESLLPGSTVTLSTYLRDSTGEWWCQHSKVLDLPDFPSDAPKGIERHIATDMEFPVRVESPPKFLAN